MLGTFKPVDDEVNDVHTTSWEKLEGQVHQAHAQLQRKRSYRKAREKAQTMEKKPYEILPDYPPSSSMEMEALMKRPKVTRENSKDAYKLKTKVHNMLDVGHTNLHIVDLQVSEGNPVFLRGFHR